MDAAKRELLAGEVVAKGVDESIGRMSLSRKPNPGTWAELTTDGVEPFIQKFGGGLNAEIDKVIGELQATRNYLQSEGERIQQETIRFAQLNHTASASIKIISDSISEWRDGCPSGRVRGHRSP
jgi:hypothetical protein